MSFYLDKIIIYNNAPFENLSLDFSKDGVNVLTGLNGRGKTTIISYIVDALVEISKEAFYNEYKDKSDSYYRLSSSVYSLDISKPSLVYIRFKNYEDSFDYVNVRGKITEDVYSQIVLIDSPINFHDFIANLEENGNIKYCKTISRKKIQEIFNNYIVPYFPSYRFEIPGYLNDVYSQNIKFSYHSSYSGYLPNKIEVIQSIDNITNWIMDVVLDWMINKQEERYQLPTGQLLVNDVTAEKNIWNNLNKIVTELFKEKSDNKPLRFGIGARNNSGQRLSIVSNEEQPKVFAPNMQVISAGEASIIGIFAEIIRQADRLHANILLNDIEGIVLIDEIDKHLHVKLQNEVLPKLLNLFPKVQFIISSHSPFLNMGLAEYSKKEIKVFDLDNNGISTEPRKTVEFENFYNSIFNENTKYAKLYESLKQKTDSLIKPVIFTEGKTDWKHIKKALSVFQAQSEFTDIDVEIFEYDFDNGDPQLFNYLKTVSKLPNPHKIIGIFDCDEDNGKKIAQLSEGIQEFGNNVYAMSIPVPSFRDNIKEISIEFLYTDDDLKRCDDNGRRLYTSDEFSEHGFLITDPSIICQNLERLKNYKTNKIPKVVDNKIFSSNDESKALSKEDFANNILTNKFDNILFEGFKPLFERIKIILEKI